MALLLTGSALAHVDLQPRLVEQGREAVLQIELPRLRPGPAPVELELEADGLEFVASHRLRIEGAETNWSVFILVSASGPTGELPVVLRALFADGRSVDVETSVVVVPPAAAEGTFPWLAAAGGVTLALIVAAAVLIRSRRRTAC